MIRSGFIFVARRLLAGAAIASTVAHAWTVTIIPAPTLVYLQVGAGAFSGGNYVDGGTPLSASVRNGVSLTVNPAILGTGPLTMSSDSTTSASFYDGATVCPGAGAKVYIGGFYRAPSGSSATLSVTSPPYLTGPGSSYIPFSTISWTTDIARSSDSVQVPAGRFAGGTTQALFTLPRNAWFEDCFTFLYDNSAGALQAGTYRGVVTYTLTAP